MTEILLYFIKLKLFKYILYFIPEILINQKESHKKFFEIKFRVNSKIKFSPCSSTIILEGTAMKAAN